jgi:hypothetical protein
MRQTQKDFNKCFQTSISSALTRSQAFFLLERAKHKLINLL